MQSMLQTAFKYISPFALLGIGLYCQLVSQDVQSIAFARSGCLVVLYGIILESFYVVRATNKGATVHKQLTITGENDPNEVLAPIDYIKMLPTHYGLIWVCVGTIVWGYGDMVK